MRDTTVFTALQFRPQRNGKAEEPFGDQVLAARKCSSGSILCRGTIA